MKTLIKTLLLIVIITNYSCSSDDDNNENTTLLTFETLSKVEIETLKPTMSDAILNATNEADGILLEPGSILLYKTNANRFGKLEVLNINPDDNFKLTANIVTYANDGTIYNQNSFFEIPGTFLIDLDELEIGELDTSKDFHWSRINTFLTRIIPFNGFVFVQYEL